VQVQSGAAWVGWGFVSARGAPQVAASLGRGTAYNVVTQALAARQAQRAHVRSPTPRPDQHPSATGPTVAATMRTRVAAPAALAAAVLAVALAPSTSPTPGPGPGRVAAGPSMQQLLDDAGRDGAPFDPALRRSAARSDAGR